ncbi:MAG: Na+/H+ antiporter NhaC [Paraglaciecola sp.]|jgi:Na+/H+ antiporter NhaC
MKNSLILTYFFLLFSTTVVFGQTLNDTLILEPKVEISPVSEVELKDYSIDCRDGKIIFQSDNLNGKAKLEIAGEETELLFKNGLANFDFEVDAAGELVLFKNKNKNNDHQLYHFSQHNDGTYRVRYIPLWMSLLPPLIAVALALLFKEVIISLFVGVWTGAFIAGGMRIESLYYFLMSIFKVVEKYVLGALTNSGHLSIIIFSLLIGGMVAIISRNGGMAGVVKSLSRYARSPRSAQFITWLLGVAIFFDDYANTLIVGNTMRSVTDKFKISREKLAYIVDSTAAPVAAIAFVTTWIGAELGYIEDGIASLENFNADMTSYAIFIASLKYSFYPVLTLIFILILIYTGKDYGPMYKAEHRARTTGRVSSALNDDDDEPNMEDLTPVKGAPLRWYNAVIPVLVVISMTLFGLIDTGFVGVYGELIEKGFTVTSQSWGDTWAMMGSLLPEDAGFFQKVGKLIGKSDSYIGLLWASTSGVIAAVILTQFQKIMKLQESMHTMVTGFKAMLPALIILTLAWALASTTEELNTATYLTFALQDSLNPYLMPVIIFILAALIAFSTGSSWSTMAILYPIAVPTTWAICQTQGIAPDVAMELLLNVIAITLAASVLGDHCSPISDTTILSSLASDCNHIDHVRTQMPYALTVGAVSITAGFLSTLLGGGWLICFILLIISIAVLFGVVWKFGKEAGE